MRKILYALCVVILASCVEHGRYKLVWSEEFDYEGSPDTSCWSYELGFVRNKEPQWYQSANAEVKNGVLTIYGRQDQVKNPEYDANSVDWRKNRMHADYTSASIITLGKKEFLYGRVEVKARVPTAFGAWAAIWTRGKNHAWPSRGEIDIMECYPRNGVMYLHANAAWGNDVPYHAIWNAKAKNIADFHAKDPDWDAKFHVWRMDWDSIAIRLYVDDELLNKILLKDTQNGSVGNYENPFKQPHHLLLNLAIDNIHGVTPDTSAFPLKFEVDYVRVYQK